MNSSRLPLGSRSTTVVCSSTIPVKRVAGKDVPLPYAANLERLAVPQVEDIVAAAREAAYR